MSIDGPGIIDSDLAHDVYNQILDLYDSGLGITDIKAKMEIYESELLDAVDVEIYLAAEAKAFWEIGHLDPGLTARLAHIVESGRSLAIWIAISDVTIAKARKVTLARLLKQIATPKRVPRKRKKYLRITSKLFKVGDCVSLEDQGRLHKAVVCKIIEHRGRCEYAMLVMDINIAPTIESFVSGKFYGRCIPSSIYDEGWVLGPSVVRIDHRMLVRSGNPFAIIGHVELDETRFILGRYGGVSELGDVLEDFRRTEEHPEIFEDELLPLSELMNRYSKVG